mmetsp:Transcript_29139/g.70234  ORF Transcript_29139/g.70234 Transcript_29139/m.70234 type:complete len:310 (+) Transcript_29139:199-1128(+)|eukprot:CAMPEP_0113465356 /NCGR_PEP_ID=MMETSP0014_2-20120614/13694_1 /TAXON_ID=2857 /ORGANISM="Nitzschia sp." /LENGTH=309 /DNA_ID=CAMNT_0000357505 /DNA_START=129 /DNA_END=1058 /DNA_ORIENTATION=+ /assembly_acc=CAM_ASM_000159
MVFFSSKALSALSCLAAVVAVATATATTTEENNMNDDIEAAKKAVLDTVYDHSYDNNASSSRRGRGGGVGGRRLDDTQSCDISVEITKCTATPIVSVGRTAPAPTAVDCDKINDEIKNSCICDIDVEYEYVVTNNAEEPTSIYKLLKKKKGGFYNGKDDEDLSVDIKFFSEAFNPVAGVPPARRLDELEGRFPAPMCNSESVVIDSPFDDGVEDPILAPGQSMTMTSTKFSLDICDCPTFIFGASATASQVSSSKSKSKKGGNGKGKSGGQSGFFEFECAAADALKTEVFGGLDRRNLQSNDGGVDGRC